MRPTRGLLLVSVCLLSAWAVPASAGSAQASFGVQINLKNPLYAGSVLGTGGAGSDYCISQTLSQATNAIVKVVCGSNQFVSINPRPGAPFLGTHGGAYRFQLQPTAPVSQDDPLWYVGAGTITTMHILHASNQDDVLEMLVSF